VNNIKIKPGDAVVTNFNGYQHWSLVSDKQCQSGKPMLISATKRNGTVEEEPWDVVTKGKETYVAEIKTNRTIPEILSIARSQIGKWVYSLTESNCEHFVKWSTGLEITSAQVKSAFIGAATGATLVGLAAKKPNAIKFLTGALIIAGLCVSFSKAREKQIDLRRTKLG